MSTAAGNTVPRKGLLMGGALALPVLVVVAYLVATRRSVHWFLPWGNYLALGLAIASGAICVWKLSRQSVWRYVIMFGYALAAAIWLVGFAVVFGCAAFGDCL